MPSEQNIHRKVAFPCPVRLSRPNIFRLSTIALICLFSISLSHQRPDSGPDFFGKAKDIAATNGLLPLRNILLPEAFVEHQLPSRKRRRRTGSSDYCKPDNFQDFLFQRSSSNEASNRGEGSGVTSTPQAYIYAITQDCQIVFARAEQMHQIGRLVEVDNRLTYCLPGLVQLHWREMETGGIGLQLLLKRTNKQICTLPVEFPQANSLLGSSIFSYSLRSSLNYAVCSFMSNSSFIMEPELSFMDTTYSDVIYFLDPNSSGAYWTVRQFKLDDRGYLKALDTFIVRNIAEQDSKYTGRPQKASEYFVALDSQRKKFFAVHKQKKSVVSTCAYDLLFRPHKVKIERSYLVPAEASTTSYAAANQHSNSNYNEVTSFSVDHSAMMFAEVFRKGDDKYSTKLFLANKLNNHSSPSPSCVLEVPFRAKFGFVTAQSLEQLNEIQLPKFSVVQIKSFKESIVKHKSTTTSPYIYVPILPITRQGMYVGDRSGELTKDQLLASPSTTRPPTRGRGKGITTKKLVIPTTIRPTTTRRRFKDKLTEGSGLGVSSEEGQLLAPTTNKENQQKERIDLPKEVEAMDESFPAGYSDYENSEEDNGFHGGGDNPLGLFKTEENAQGVTSTRWQNTRKGWPSTATTAKPVEKQKTGEPAAHFNTFVDGGEPSLGAAIGCERMTTISSLVTIDILVALLFL